MTERQEIREMRATVTAMLQPRPSNGDAGDFWRLPYVILAAGETSMRFDISGDVLADVQQFFRSNGEPLHEGENGWSRVIWQVAARFGWKVGEHGAIFLDLGPQDGVVVHLLGRDVPTALRFFTEKGEAVTDEVGWW